MNISDNLEEISENAAQFFLKIHKRSFNPFYIFPGGSTPVIFYQKLSQYIDNWTSTSLLLSDERMVDGKHRLSNSYQIKKNLLNRIEGKKLPVFLSYTEFMTTNMQGINYSFNKKLEKIGNPEIAILGLGNDGHTASLFPNNSEIFTSNREIYIIVKNDYDNFFRVSLTFDYIMKAKQIVFLISGKEKSSILNSCLKKPYDPIKWPVQYLFKNYNNKINIYCDKNAASMMIN